MTDNHWLPAVHLDKPETDTLLAFLSANPGATASFTQGAKATWQGDVITAFSSRGPGGDFLKPDVTAPGLHILAGQTPTPECTGRAARPATSTRSSRAPRCRRRTSRARRRWCSRCTRTGRRAR